MRTAFRARLAALDSTLVEVSQRVRHAVSAATAAALAGDLAGSEAVISDVGDIEDAARAAADDAVRLMAQQQPVAQDLRALLTAGRIAASLQRMARLAGHIATCARRAYPGTVAPAEVGGVLADMGGVADRMLGRVTDALARRDPGAAAELVALDREMDRLHQEMLAIVRSRAWPFAVDTAVDLTLLSRDYERIADHAVDVAGAVVDVVTAVPPPTHMH